MQLVEELTISRKSIRSTENKPKNGKRSYRKGKRTEEEQKLIESLFDENKKLYETAKRRGYSLPEEKARYQEIRFELIRLKAI